MEAMESQFKVSLSSGVNSVVHEAVHAVCYQWALGVSLLVELLLDLLAHLNQDHPDPLLLLNCCHIVI